MMRDGGAHREHQPPAVQAVGEHAAQQPEKEDRRQLRERQHTEVEDRAGQLESHPAHGDDAEPHAHRRDKAAPHEQGEISVDERVGEA